MKKVFDIEPIIKKLKEADLVEEQPGILCGTFSINNHGHLLTAEELKSWIEVLHQSGVHPKEKCTDLHAWNFQFIND